MWMWAYMVYGDGLVYHPAPCPVFPRQAGQKKTVIDNEWVTEWINELMKKRVYVLHKRLTLNLTQ